MNPEIEQRYAKLLEHASQKIADLQAEVDTLKQAQSEPIAVIGLGCRFPGEANTPTQLWQLLQQGIDTVAEPPRKRWDLIGVEHPDDLPQLLGGFISNVDQFDAQFFGVSPREANSLDPQQRLLLEICWEALERAAIAPDSLFGTATGVFMGITASDYQYLFSQMLESNTEDGVYLITGNSLSAVAGRISYTLGLTGPAVVTDTSCSSSLVTVHQACQSLRQGECDLALAGGVSLMLRIDSLAKHFAGQVFSPDGRCKTFDTAANSFGRGEGCGVVVLKRLSDALADGDNILATIEGSMLNQDGRTNGMTAPNGLAQQQVIQQALKTSGIDPDHVGYIEAHGTGTSIGDPIEIEALTAVFRKRTKPLLVGSIKTNMGHLEGAAGIAGLIKAILAISHAEIPPNLHFNHPNSYIDWQASPLQVCTELTPWPQAMERRIAGVSSFGFSGTNAHVVLAEAPATRSESEVDAVPPCILPLSAKTDQALRDLAQNYVDYLASHPTVDLADVCYTAQIGRTHFERRLAVTAESLSDAQAKLAEFVNRPTSSSSGSGLAFLFTGQGAQYAGMGQELYNSEPIFRQAIDACAQILDSHLDQPLLSILYPTKPEATETSTIHQTAYTQPALFALEYALAQLWQAWGIIPEVVLGHSVGEIVAACVAGVFSLEDGLKLVAARGRLMAALPQNGAMAVINADLGTVESAVASHPTEVSIAAINGPQNVVISGRRETIQTVVANFEAKGVTTRPLTVSHAFHSPLMEAMLAEFEAVLAEINFKKPKIKLISNLTGQLASDELATPAYWLKHIRQPVRFTDSMTTLDQLDLNTFVELGPKPALVSLGQQCLPQLEGYWLSSLRQAVSDRQQMLDSLSTLYQLGYKIDWAGFNQSTAASKIPLPTYPFQRQSHWLTVSTSQPKPQHLGPLLDKMLHLPDQQQVIFETEFSKPRLPFLADHLLYNNIVSPAAAQLAMVLSAAQEVYGSIACQISDVVLPRPLMIHQEAVRTVQTRLSATELQASANRYEFQLLSFAPDDSITEPTPHALGQLSTISKVISESVDLRLLREHSSIELDVEALYDLSVQNDVFFGPNFRWVTEAWQGTLEDKTPTALAKLSRPAVVQDQAGYAIHPGLLDACFQVSGLGDPSLTDDNETDTKLWLPFAVDSIQLYQPIHGTEWWCYAQQSDVISPDDSTSLDDTPPSWNIQLFDTQGKLVAAVNGLQVRAAPEMLLGRESWRDWLYEVKWSLKPIFGLTPDFLAAPSQIQTLITNQPDTSPPTPAEYPSSDDVIRYQTVMKESDTVSVAYIWQAFAQAGITFDKPWRIEQIADHLGLVSSYQRLLKRMLSILVEVGLLQGDDAGWQAISEPTLTQPSQQIEALLAEYGDIAGWDLRLLRSCGEKLGQVLNGQQNPLLLLFPEDETAESREENQKSPGIQVMSRQIQQAVLAAVKTLPPERGVRILEVGAGTGSATKWLLPHLPAEQTDYVFTDISAAFFPAAREQFTAYDFIHYTTFNLEESPLAQDFRQNQYDIVVASNVLHATKDLTETLAHIHQVLAPSGLLIFLEAIRPSYGIDITFGLTDGWWRFADMRTDHPLLPVTDWQQLLLDNGFVTVSTVEDEAIDLAQTVFIAQRDQAISPQSQPWLIFAGETGLAQTLADELSARSEQVIWVQPGDAFNRESDHIFCLNPAEPTDYQRLFQEIPMMRGIVHMWSLCPEIINTKTDLKTSMVQGTQSALYLAQAMLDARLETGLWLVTIEAQAVHGADSVTGFGYSSLWGLGRVLRLEQPHLPFICLDLDKSADSLKQQANLLCAELMTQPSPQFQEDQIAIRGQSRYVARLADFETLDTIADTNESFQLEVRGTNTIDNLKLYPVPRRTLKTDEVEIKVYATGLNFIDILDALGMMPYERIGGLGGECAGEVVAMGADVTGLNIGDRVVALAPTCFSKYATTPAPFVLPIPDHLSFAEAATIPANFLTAYEALHKFGHISANDRVLIHAAAGGTGMAAVRVAQQVGAEIFATASPGKWQALRDLGIKHIYNSRTLDFADQIMADTDGQGVDIVLNSLTSDGFVEKGLSILAPQGRFLEIAGINVWEEAQVKAFRPDVAYHRIVMSLEPSVMRPMFETLMAQFTAKTLQPVPHTPFPIQEAVQAFRFMQQAKHIGKIVLTQPEERQIEIQAEASYLITGGLSGLGLLVARWLVEQGAQHLVLVGRSQPKTDAQTQLAELAELGAQVTVAQADVTNLAQMEGVLARIDEAHPLRGIVHSVGVLDDAQLPQQTWERFIKVLNPKMVGAWNLHQLSQETPLDFFVLFSSAVGLMGNHGQANHAAANAFLDSFVAYRRGLGLPALSIGWGAWSTIGSAAEQVERTQQQMAASGIGSISPDRGIEAFAHLLQQDTAYVSVMPIEWSKFLANAAEGNLTSQFLSIYQQRLKASIQPPAEPQGSIRQELEALPPDERAEVLLQHLRDTLARVLGLPDGNTIDPHQGLMDMGLDSLMAIEMRNYLVNTTGLKLSPTALFDYPTLAALNKFILARLFEAPTIKADEPEPSELSLMDESELDDLSPDELAKMLAEELESLKGMDE